MEKLEAKNPDRAKKLEWLKDRNKYVTGFCNEHNKPGQHEGTKPKTQSGKGIKTCPYWQTCPCECHYNVDMLFEMTGQERLEIQNPEYAPYFGDFALPEYVEPTILEPALTVTGAIESPDLEHIATVPPAPAAEPLVARRTETGRAARGGLEAQVWEAIHALNGESDKTPKIVSEWIANKYVIPTPSSGAINAVWDRWTVLGFCEQAKKPNRFLKFTKEGTWDELQRLKNSAKVQKRSTESAQRRGFR